MLDERDLITGGPLGGGEDAEVRLMTERLLLDLGYRAGEVAVDLTKRVEAGGGVEVRADLVLFSAGRAALVIRAARGSLVSREKEAVAAARLIAEPMAPLAVVTNGEDAELLDSASGRVLAAGLAALPGPQALAERLADMPSHTPNAKEKEKAARVYAAFSAICCHNFCPAEPGEA